MELLSLLNYLSFYFWFPYIYYYYFYLFRNPDSRYNNTKSAEFGGAGTCKEMHPCPFDIQDIVGIHLPESEHNIAKFITDNEVDMHLDLMS